MKNILTLAMNPGIDKSSSVENVIAEQKLNCKPPRFEPGGGRVNVSRAIKKLGGESVLIYPTGCYTGNRLRISWKMKRYVIGQFLSQERPARASSCWKNPPANNSVSGCQGRI